MSIEQQTDTRLFDSGYPMQIGNEQYTASMFTDRDYGDLDNWIRKKFITMGTEAADLLQNGMKDKLIEVTLKTATKVGWMTEEGNNLMASLDGVLQLGYQLIRKRHPTIKLSEFKIDFEIDKKKAIDEINKADIALNYVKKKVETDQGGSVTGNPKS